MTFPMPRPFGPPFPGTNPTTLNPTVSKGTNTTRPPAKSSGCIFSLFRSTAHDPGSTLPTRLTERLPGSTLVTTIPSQSYTASFFRQHGRSVAGALGITAALLSQRALNDRPFTAESTFKILGQATLLSAVAFAAGEAFTRTHQLGRLVSTWAKSEDTAKKTVPTVTTVPGTGVNLPVVIK